jgi:hypothetical protein
VPSSVIHGMLYSPQEKTLSIVFRSVPGVYRYFDVGPEEWTAFKRAPSKGTYLNAVFKARHPRFERLDVVRGGLMMAVAAGEAGPRDSPDENVWGFYENLL